VFEAREPEPIPIRRIPGLRDAKDPLNRIIRIRADAADGFDDSACAPDYSVAFLHGFAALTQTCPESDLRWADSSLYVPGARNSPPNELLMADQIVITEKTSQAKDIRAAVGSRYGDILPAEGHLFDLLEPEDLIPAWKRWSPILLRPEGLYGTRPAEGGNKAAKLKAARTGNPELRAGGLF
jgi:hypothetical protein